MQLLIFFFFFTEGRYGNNGNSGNNGHRVLLKNVKNSISLKVLKMQLERAYGPIFDIDLDQQKVA
jgi:hypothetical protein